MEESVGVKIKYLIRDDTELCGIKILVINFLFLFLSHISIPSDSIQTIYSTK